MSQSIAETSSVVKEALAEESEIFYQSAEFWVGMSFVLVAVLLFPLIFKALKKVATERIERIKKELEEAETLKLDAQKLYADYERKFINTDNEIAEIVQNQEEIIKKTKETKIAELDKLLKHKQNLAEAKIDERYKQEQLNINRLVCKKASVILNEAFKSKLTKKEYSKLIDNSINNIKSIEMEQING